VLDLREEALADELIAPIFACADIDLSMLLLLRD